MKVKVTQKHIDNGNPTGATSCAISLAIKSRFWFPRFHEVITGVCFCYIDKHPYKLPYEAMTFIKNFDNGKPVKPFTFKLERM